MATKSDEHVHTLLEKAAKVHGGAEAMQYAQAACNAANALLALKQSAPLRERQ